MPHTMLSRALPRTPPVHTQIGADMLPQYGEYLLYSERERGRKAINPATKRADKKRLQENLTSKVKRMCAFNKRQLC